MALSGWEQEGEETASGGKVQFGHATIGLACSVSSDLPSLGVVCSLAMDTWNRVPELSGVLRKHNKKALGHWSILVVPGLEAVPGIGYPAVRGSLPSLPSGTAGCVHQQINGNITASRGGAGHRKPLCQKVTYTNGIRKPSGYEEGSDSQSDSKLSLPHVRDVISGTRF